MTDMTGPSVWVLTTERLGDNAQVLAIAESLGWPFEIKHIASSTLAPPWPDLVLTIGEQAAIVALQIRQSSGGRSRLVQVGTGDQRLGFACFDLVIANPQCPIPARANVMQLALPLSFVAESALSDGATRWEPVWSRFPRPWIALFVGGPAYPLMLDAAVARRMMQAVATTTMQERGSLFVSTSPRTPSDVVAALEHGMPESGFLHRWTSDVTANPYPALVRLADRFVATEDSISMQIEVIRLGKPLAVYRLPQHPVTLRHRCRRFVRTVGLALGKRAVSTELAGRPRGMRERLERLGLLHYRRDFSRFHRQLVSGRMAVPFGEPFLPPQAPPADERPLVTARIQSLFHPAPA